MSTKTTSTETATATAQPNGKVPKKKASSVRHTRAIQRDRSKRPAGPPPPEQIEAQLTEFVQPATLAQLDYYGQLGLRERVLTLPVMVGLVLSMIWRQIGGVSELIRLLRSEKMLWVEPRQVSQQAVSERLTSLPAELFERILQAVLLQMHARWGARQRPVPVELAWARAHFSQLLIVDGSTLDGLLRKLKMLRDKPEHPLAGRMMAVLDLGSRLPHRLWYTPQATKHDQRFWPDILATVTAGSLLIFDLGYTNYKVFGQLTAAGVTFLTRAKRNQVSEVIRYFCKTATVHDQLIWLGGGDHRQPVRLIEVLYHGTWYRYLTNALDPAQMPVGYAVALYWQRWRIEDAYAIVKRLLGLAYFWAGGENGIQLQLWATWLLYAMLVDVTDAVAAELNRPLADLSLEMIYRSLFHFPHVYQRGEATDVIAWVAANAKWLGVLKRPRKRLDEKRLALTQLMET